MFASLVGWVAAGYREVSFVRGVCGVRICSRCGALQLLVV